MLKKNICLIFFLILFISDSFSHLCNDVFVQAEDNLAVKVDIRDGQLRISDTGSFKVYVLNTMDRAIQKLNLVVESEEFDVEVKPSPTWGMYPYLDTANPNVHSSAEYRGKRNTL